MFDVHCHILTETNTEKALDCIKEAAQSGVKRIILTPKIEEDDHVPYKKKRFYKHFNKLKEIVAKQEIPIELELGMELEAFYLIEEDISKYDLTLGKSSYVLINCKDYKQSIDALVYEVKIAGYQPIIPDVARYNKHNLYNRMKQWKKTGAMIQVNATSVFHKERAVRRRARKIIKLGLADFIGSGASHNNDGYKELRKAKWYVRFWCSKKYTSDMFQYNAKKIFKETEA